MMGKGPRRASFVGRLSLSQRVLYQRFHCSMLTFNVFRSTQDCGNWPFTGATDSFGWTEYACVNVRECINEQLPNTEFITYDRHTVTSVLFGWRRSFYVDNLAIARTPIQGMTY